MTNIQQQKPLKVLLLGDICKDEYYFGHIDKLSPEAPVPILTLEYKKIQDGMAANVKANLEALGCSVDFLHGKLYSTKTRLIDIRSGQHVVRVDNDLISNPVEVYDIPEDLQQYDAIVISDYCKGSIDYTLVEHIIKKYPGKVFIDTKKTDLVRFEGAVVKVNAHEASKLTSKPTDLIITLGAQGAEFRGSKYYAPEVPVKDVCGAGDTFMASLVYKACLTNSVETAIPFAIRAASISVQHLGVYAPNLKEVENV